MFSIAPLLFDCHLWLRRLASGLPGGGVTDGYHRSPKIREPRNTPNTRKQGITVGGFVSVCSACSVVKNGIAAQAQDHLPDQIGLTIDSVRVCGNQSIGLSYFSKERKLRRLGTSPPLSISNTSLSISSIMELAIGGLSSGPEKSHQNRIGRSR